MRTDRNQLRFNQALLVILLPLAALLDWPWLVYLLFLLMASQHTPWDLLVALKRLLRIPPSPVEEDPRPHRFARTLGALFLGLASLALLLGLEGLGYGLALLVALLAFVNLAFGFCLGCFLYLHLRYARALITGR
ncbi:DUF4395 family protein [Thermus oshimai]|jgi:hypothetical protein|uniref:DUF4395 domain-containing protein n=1 Tax=Thermus oshimai JL-2 TaxID=751945 RepID=K7QWB0_THEOS|nr:DUF4395 domain-containing protein [Thermus oshimai]AFV76971.1 hypothetical protein Theos_1967 [Thermus oshimai JL-2]